MTSNTFCVPNISAKERRWRLKYGLVTLLLGLVILAGFIALFLAIATLVLPVW